jgi:hypothetical protein
MEHPQAVQVQQVKVILVVQVQTVAKKVAVAEEVLLVLVHKVHNLIMALVVLVVQQELQQ